MEMIVYILIFFIFWIICNCIVERMSRDDSLSEEFIISAIKYRNAIMFDIVVLIFFIIFDVNFLLWLGIIYYVIISILEGIMLVISIITNLDYYLKERIFEKELWILVLAKTLNKIISVSMIFILSSLVIIPRLSRGLFTHNA